MSHKARSLLLATCFFVAAMASEAESAKIYLDPDSVFLTGGVGEEFDLDLSVDAATVGLRLYQVYINYQVSLLDTVSFTLGPLFANSGYSAIFNYAVVYDTVTFDTALRVEALLLGAGAVVDGPGVVATIRLRVIGSGVADLGILRHVLTDVLNDTIPSTSEGSVAFLNAPPDSFDLTSPGFGENVTGFPGDSIALIWSQSNSFYPGENVFYTLEYSMSGSFPPESTVYVMVLDTMHYLLVDNLTDGTYYWRVRAIGTLYGFEREGTPFPSTFEFLYGTVEPDEFDLLEPTDGSLINIRDKDSLLFDWEDAGSINPNDTIRYVFYLGPDSSFSPGSEILIDSTEEISHLKIATDTLPVVEWEYWRVRATNRFDLSRWSTSVFSAQFFVRGDVDGSGSIDIADLTYLVDYLFRGGPLPPCTEGGNVDGDAGNQINVGDLTYLVAYLFRGGPPPPPSP